MPCALSDSQDFGESSNDDRLLAFLQGLWVEVDPEATTAHRDRRVAFAKRVDDVVGSQAGRGAVDRDESSRHWLSRFAREIAARRDAGLFSVERRDKASHDLLVMLHQRPVILAKVPLDGGENAGQLFLADLHWPTDILIRARVDVNPLDDRLAPKNEAGGLRSLEAFAPREDRDIGSQFFGKTQEIPLTRKLRRGVDNDRHIVPVRAF